MLLLFTPLSKTITIFHNVLHCLTKILRKFFLLRSLIWFFQNASCNQNKNGEIFRTCYSYYNFCYLPDRNTIKTMLGYDTDSVLKLIKVRCLLLYCLIQKFPRTRILHFSIVDSCPFNRVQGRICVRLAIVGTIFICLATRSELGNIMLIICNMRAVQFCKIWLRSIIRKMNLSTFNGE